VIYRYQSHGFMLIEQFCVWLEAKQKVIIRETYLQPRARISDQDQSCPGRKWEKIPRKPANRMSARRKILQVYLTDSYLQLTFFWHLIYDWCISDDIMWKEMENPKPSTSSAGTEKNENPKTAKRSPRPKMTFRKSIKIISEEYCMFDMS